MEKKSKFQTTEAPFVVVVNEALTEADIETCPSWQFVTPTPWGQTFSTEEVTF